MHGANHTPGPVSLWFTGGDQGYGTLRTKVRIYKIKTFGGWTGKTRVLASSGESSAYAPPRPARLMEEHVFHFPLASVFVALAGEPLQPWLQIQSTQRGNDPCHLFNGAIPFL